METIQDNTRFNYIFWFIVGIVAFGGVLTVLLILHPVPKENERFADTALVFWLSTAVSGGIGYLIGSSAPPHAVTPAGTPTDPISTTDVPAPEPITKKEEDKEVTDVII